jgi:hypothetical protein
MPVGERSVNEFDESILVNTVVDDGINKVQVEGYTTAWSPPQDDNSSIFCTTVFVKNNLKKSVILSSERPINPDLAPAARNWLQVTSTYPRTVVDSFTWDPITSKWDLLVGI